MRKSRTNNVSEPKNLALFLLDKIKEKPYVLSAFWDQNGIPYRDECDIRKYAEIGLGTLVICIYPFIAVSEATMNALDKNVVAEITGNKITIHLMVFSNEFHTWVQEFKAKTGQKVHIN